MRERLEIDPAHSVIGFSTKHMGVSTVRGHFREYSGWFEGDEETLQDPQGEVEINVLSITTNQEQRDTHLRSGDFFAADQYPTINYRLTGVEKTGENAYRVQGDLTIKSTTKPITLEATVEGSGADPFGAGRRIGVTARGQLNRMDYGLNWDGLAGTVPLAGHTIKIEIELELVASPVGADAHATVPA